MNVWSDRSQQVLVQDRDEVAPNAIPVGGNECTEKEKEIILRGVERPVGAHHLDDLDRYAQPDPDHHVGVKNIAGLPCWTTG